jgi:transglutaminase/protease-like cytokinesis protein 3
VIVKQANQEESAIKPKTQETTPANNQTHDQERTTEPASNLGLARDQLNPELQSAYDEILRNLQEFQDEIPISYDKETTRLITTAIMADHPELFWLDGSWTIQSTSKGNLLIPSHVPTRQQAEETLAQMDEIANEMTASAGPYDHEIAWATYCALAETCTYDLEAPNQQTAFGAMIDKRAVCAGYARAFQYVMHKHGIPCGIVTGECDGERHMWCIAKLDGTWCQIDPTWGDAEKGSDDSLDDLGPLPEYFGMTDEKIAQSGHVIDNPNDFPACDSREHSPLVRADLVISQPDDARLSERFWKQIKNGSAMFEFDTDDAWKWASQMLNEGTFLQSDLQKLARQRGLDTIQYTWRVDDKLHVVQIAA